MLVKRASVTGAWPIKIHSAQEKHYCQNDYVLLGEGIAAQAGFLMKKLPPVHQF